MAEQNKLKNIFTAISAMFGKTRPGEFNARSNVEKALAANKRDLAAKPILNPTEMSRKGVGKGSILSDENSVGKNYHKYLERETVRHMRYIIYDRMDTDLIASALDVYANEATQRNSNDDIIGVSSTSKYIEEELTDMLRDCGLNNFRTWSIIRDMCKYGDHFSSIRLDSIQGVTGLLDLDPSSVYRLEDEGELMGYIQDLDVIKSAIVNTTTSNTNPYINLNSLTMPYLINHEESDRDEDLVPFLKYELAHFRLRGRGDFLPYGSSILETAVEVWKKLDLLFDSLIIYRLNRAPARLVFYVDVGNNQGADAENLVKKQINSITKKEYFDSNGKLNERYQLLDMNANLYIPTQKNSSSKVELLGAAPNVGEIEDVAFLNNRLFSALKVPKSFLGYEGDVSSKGMLSQQNVTFSKAIQNIQEDFLETVKDLCLIHLAIRGVAELDDLSSFDLVMSRPSYLEEKARLEIEAAMMNLAGQYTGAGVNRRWVAKNIMRKTDAEVEEMFTPDPTDPLAQQAAAGGGAIGGGMEMPLGGEAGLGMPQVEQPPMEAAQPSGPNISQPGQEGGVPAEAGQQPLTQGKVYAGGVLIENTTVIKRIRRPGKEIKVLLDDITTNGLRNKKTKVITKLSENKKLLLTEPEEIL